MRRMICGFALVLVLGTATLGGDWPMFRGPGGDGTTDEKNLPTEWGAETNVKWKTALPAPANGSPVVSGDRVYVTYAEDQGRKRSLACYNREDGSQRWVQTVDFDQVEPTHQTNPYAATTPATDGERVVVFHGSAGLHCYDKDGKILWSRDLGEFRHVWGYASSPIIDGNRVLLNAGPGKEIFMTSIDLASGETRWRTDEPQDGDGVKREDGKWMGSWSTPVFATVGGKRQLICSMPSRVVAFDPDSGKILWYCEGLRHGRGSLAYSSPVIGDGVCVSIGGYRGPMMAIRLDPKASGDITETHRLWREENNPQSIGTGIILDGHLYNAAAGPGLIQCIEVKTGDVLWQERAGSHWGSPVMADGRMYVTNKEGVTNVFQPRPAGYEEVARNSLGEPSNSTPALSDGQIFVRTFGHLWCIEE